MFLHVERQRSRASTGKHRPGRSDAYQTARFQRRDLRNTKDTVIALLDFNKKLCATLPREDMQKFADAIFVEITKMFVTVDQQHWVNKYNYQAAQKVEEEKNAKSDLEALSGGNTPGKNEPE